MSQFLLSKVLESLCVLLPFKECVTCKVITCLTGWFGSMMGVKCQPFIGVTQVQVPTKFQTEDILKWNKSHVESPFIGPCSELYPPVSGDWLA